MIETKIELRKLTPSDGYTLFDGETLSKEVYLGIHDSPDRWQEIPDEEAAEIEKALSEQQGVEVSV